MNKKYLGYGLALLGLGYIGYYVWGLTTVKDRAKVTKVDIVDVGLTWVKLQLTVVNFSTVSIPFNGFSGKVEAKGYDISDLYLAPNNTTLEAGQTVLYQVQGSVNWFQLAGLIPNIVQMISSGNWKGVIADLQATVKGEFYSGNFTAAVNLPLV
jgi:hypothetical protein